MNSINTGTITPGKNPMFGQVKIAATTINVVNSFSTIFLSYLLFFKKTASKTIYRLYRFMNHHLVNSRFELFRSTRNKILNDLSYLNKQDTNFVSCLCK